MSELHGRSIIAGETVGGGETSGRAFKPSAGQAFAPEYYEATSAEVDRLLLATRSRQPWRQAAETSAIPGCSMIRRNIAL
jgi:hypothetical protein